MSNGVMSLTTGGGVIPLVVAPGASSTFDCGNGSETIQGAALDEGVEIPDAFIRCNVSMKDAHVSCYSTLKKT